MIQSKEFRRLNAFKTVYESNSISKAARTLFLTQSAVSSQIQQLEEELQVPLFNRQGRNSLSPTEAGKVLYSQVTEILEMWHNTTQLLTEQSANKLKCTIAASNSFAISMIPQLMKYLTERHTDVEFTVIESNSEEVYNMLLRRDIDFGFVERSFPTHAKINQREILKDSLVLVENEGSDIWLMREKRSAINYFNEHYLAENDIKPKAILHLNTNDMIIRVLQQGIGRSLVSQSNLDIHDIPYKVIDKRYERYFYLVTPVTTTLAYEEVKDSVEAWYRNERDKTK